MDDAESKRRMAEAKASGDHNFYMMEMGPGLIIDARTKYAFSFTSSGPRVAKSAYVCSHGHHNSGLSPCMCLFSGSALTELLRSFMSSSAPMQHLCGLHLHVD